MALPPRSLLPAHTASPRAQRRASSTETGRPRGISTAGGEGRTPPPEEFAQRATGATRPRCCTPRDPSDEDPGQPLDAVGARLVRPLCPRRGTPQVICRERPESKGGHVGRRDRERIHAVARPIPRRRDAGPRRSRATPRSPGGSCPTARRSCCARRPASTGLPMHHAVDHDDRVRAQHEAPGASVRRAARRPRAFATALAAASAAGVVAVHASRRPRRRRPRTALRVAQERDRGGEAIARPGRAGSRPGMGAGPPLMRRVALSGSATSSSARRRGRSPARRSRGCRSCGRRSRRMSRAKSPRTVPGAASSGLVAPIMMRTTLDGRRSLPPPWRRPDPR